MCARAIATLLLALLATGCDRLVDREVRRTLQRVDTAVLESPDLTVVLCGTGSPLADPDRAGACTAVIAGGRFFLVDVGPGSWEVVDLASLPLGELDGVLLTHFHSDHIGDLGEAITQSWIAGRIVPLDVHGPAGVARVVAGFAEAYAFDVEARVAHHGEKAMPRGAAGAVARETELGNGPSAAATIYEKDGLRITMFRVDHLPVEPAVGYRFDWRGRSVVISGDTKKSASVVEHARGADLLIHEALDPTLTERAVEMARELGMERLAKLAGDIPSYHASPREAGEVAKEAGARHLVLTHLVPPPRNFVLRRRFSSAARKSFGGEVTVGADGMRFVLPAVPGAPAP